MAAFADHAVFALVNAVCPKPLRVLLRETDPRETSEDAQSGPQQIAGVDGAGAFGSSQARTRPPSDASVLEKPEPADIRVTESYTFQPPSAPAEKSKTSAAADEARDEASCLAEKVSARELRDELANYREEKKRAKEESERFARELEKLRAAVEERDREVLELKSPKMAIGADAETSESTLGHMLRHAANTESPPAGSSEREVAGSRPGKGPPWHQDWQEMSDLAMHPENTSLPAPVRAAGAGDTGWGILKASESSWDVESSILERAISLGGAEAAEKWAPGPTYDEAKPIRATWAAAGIHKDADPKATAPNTAGTAEAHSWSRKLRDTTMKPVASSAPASPTPVADKQRDFLPPSIRPSPFAGPKFETGTAFGNGGGHDFLPRDQILGSTTSRDAWPTNPGLRKPDGDGAKPSSETVSEGYIDLIMKEKEKCEKYVNQTKRLGDELHRKLAFCAELLGKPAEDDYNTGGSGLDPPTNDVGIQFKSTRKISYRHPSATFPGSVTAA